MEPLSLFFARGSGPNGPRLRVTNGEDNVIAESQQVGLSQRLNRPGRYTEHELLVHAFVNHVLDRVLGERVGVRGGCLSMRVHSFYTPKYRCCSASSARKLSESPDHTTWPFSMM